MIAETLEQSTSPVWFIRLNSRTISNANAAACALTGHSQDEIIGKPMEELFTPEGVVHILTHCRACGDMSSDFGSVAVIKKDRSVQQLEVFCQIPSQEQSLFLILGRMPEQPSQCTTLTPGAWSPKEHGSP